MARWMVLMGSTVAHLVKREPCGGPRAILWRVVCNDMGFLPPYVAKEDGRPRCKRCLAAEKPPPKGGRDA